MSITTVRPVVGKYILDTLSIGMYNNPLMLYREYIQNSVDAIDNLASNNGSYNQKEPRIDIHIDGQLRSIKITDNGKGLTFEEAVQLLHDLGQSNKSAKFNRGFRGIGRLGGLGYCDSLIFRTKSKGENTVTVSKWDCIKLRESITEGYHHTFKDAAELISQVVTLDQEHEQDKNKHFFEVEMHNVKSPRDILLNVPSVYSYLSQVAPVPFNKKQFHFADKINKHLLDNRVPNYHAYGIFLNDMQVFKPYKDAVPIGRGVRDHIRGIEFIKLENAGTTLAVGWIASMEFSGCINPTSAIDGIRLRSGNILIGDNYSLSGHFKERRFNNYLVGELHIADHRLIPNSRRDDLEDNIAKEKFVVSFVRNIGHPYSRLIRDASKARSNTSRMNAHSYQIANAKKVAKHGHLVIAQKKQVIASLRKVQAENSKYNGKVDKLIAQVANSSHILERSKRLAPRTKKMLTNIFDLIYSSSPDKKVAEKTIGQIVNKVVKGAR